MTTPQPNNQQYPQQPQQAPQQYQPQQPQQTPQQYQQPQQQVSVANLTPDDLKPRTTVVVKGEVRFNRISSHIKDEELATYNARRRQSNPKIRFDMGPHTTITVSHPEIVPMEGGDQDQRTVEQYVSEKLFYHSKKYNETQASFQSRTKQLPNVWERGEDGNFVQVNPVADDLTAGQNVFVVISTYESDNGKNGIGLNEVYVDGKAQLGNARGRDLSAFGLVTNAAPQPTIGAEAPAQAAPQQGYAQQGSAQQGYAQPPQMSYENGNQQQAPQQGFPQQQAPQAPQQAPQQGFQPQQAQQQAYQPQQPQQAPQQGFPQQQQAPQQDSSQSPWPNGYTQDSYNGGITYNG